MGQYPRHSKQLAGLEWTSSLAFEIDQHIDEIPLLEIIPENFFPSLGNAPSERLFRMIREKDIGVLVHSVGLSIASIEPLKQDYFDEVKKIGDQLPTVSYSDHLCLTEMEGSEIGQLTPCPYNKDTLDAVCEKIERIQDQIDKPFAIENITHTFFIPDQEFEEPEFITQVINRTGCELLLDLNNIHTNGVNFGVDPYNYIAGLDLDKIDSMHLAGGFFDEDKFLQDGHCEPVPDAVWELFEHVIQKAGRPIATIVERTGNNAKTGLAPVLADQNKAQAIMDRILAPQVKTQTAEISANV